MRLPFFAIGFFSLLAAAAGCHLLNDLGDNSYGAGGSGAAAGSGGSTSSSSSGGGAGGSGSGAGGMGTCATPCGECQLCNTSNVCVTAPGQSCESLAGGSCDSIGECVNGQAQWVRLFGSAGAERANAIGIDSKGRVVIGGDVYGASAITFGAHVVGSSNPAEADVFSATLDAGDGNGIAATDSGNGFNQHLTALVTNGTNVVLAGNFMGTVFGALTANGSDGFVVAVSEDLLPGMMPSWSDYAVGANTQAFNDVSGGGDLLVAAGGYTGTLTLPSPLTNLSSDAMSSDAMIIGYAPEPASAPASEPLWAADFDGPSTSSANALGVAVGPNGDVVVVGTYSGAPTFMTSAALPDAKASTSIFVAKLTSAGAFVWIKTFGNDTNNQVAEDVAFDGNNIVVVGEYLGSMGVDGIPDQLNSPDVFVLKLDQDGEVMWGSAHPSAGLAHAYGVAVDSHHNIVLVGDFTGTITCKVMHVCHGGTTDAFVFKLTEDGNRIWTYTAGAEGTPDAFWDVVIDANDNVLVAGEVSGNLADDGLAGMTNTPNAAMGADILVAKLAP